MRTLAVTAAVLALASAAVGSRVTLVDNGYSGLVIGVDERVDVTQCQEILQNLQVSLGVYPEGWSDRSDPSPRVPHASVRDIDIEHRPVQVSTANV